MIKLLFTRTKKYFAPFIATEKQWLKQIVFSSYNLLLFTFNRIFYDNELMI